MRLMFISVNPNLQTLNCTSHTRLSQSSPRASLVTEIICVNSGCKTFNFMPLKHSRYFLPTASSLLMQIINQIQMSLRIIIVSYDFYRHVSASLLLQQCVGLSSDGRPTVFALTVPSFRIHLHRDLPVYFLLHLCCLFFSTVVSVKHLGIQY